MFPSYIGLYRQASQDSQVNAVELASKVCFLLFDVDLSQRYQCS